MTVTSAGQNFAEALSLLVPLASPSWRFLLVFKNNKGRHLRPLHAVPIRKDRNTESFALILLVDCFPTRHSKDVDNGGEGQ